MRNNLEISHIQLRALIVAATMGVGVISLPNELANILGKDGWILILLSGLLLTPVYLMINYIFKVNPGKNYFNIGEEALGKVIFTIYKFVFISYLIVYLSILVRTLSELIKAFLLPTTPVEAIALIFILSSLYLSSMEIDIIARSSYVIYPVILIFVGIFIFITLPTADFSGMLPAFQEDFRKIPKGIISTFLSFTGFEIMLFALPYVKDKKKAVKSSMMAVGTITLIYILLFFITLTQFHMVQIKKQSFALLMIAKIVDLPGYFLQNLDGVIMGLWTLIVFATFASGFYSIGKIFSNVFNTKEHRYFLMGLVPVIYFLSLYPENYLELQGKILLIYNILGLISTVGVPIIIFTITVIKRRRDA